MKNILLILLLILPLGCGWLKGKDGKDGEKGMDGENGISAIIGPIIPDESNDPECGDGNHHHISGEAYEYYKCWETHPSPGEIWNYRLEAYKIEAENGIPFFNEYLSYVSPVRWRLRVSTWHEGERIILSLNSNPVKVYAPYIPKPDDIYQGTPIEITAKVTSAGGSNQSRVVHIEIYTVKKD